ncbi:MAG: hypothetical protein ACRDRK_17070 [Pseudonocardia sp.]
MDDADRAEAPLSVARTHLDRHLVFPTNIQAHGMQGIVRDVDRRTQFELSLKVAAILTRGVVISDSDLNDNGLLYGQMEQGATFRKAIEAGFVRRAARVAPDGSPVSQAAVREQLTRSNPERAANVPVEHVAALDVAFGRVEESGVNPPLTWTLERLSSLYSERLREILDIGRKSSPNAATRSLYNRVYNYVESELSAGRTIRAAAIEATMQRAMTDAERPAWPRVFDDALVAYDGNIPIALELTLTDLVSKPIPFLPSGPESGDAELARELQVYADVADGSSNRFRIERSALPTPEPLGRLEIDYERLAQVDIQDLIQVREEARPDAFFDSRHRSLGSSDLLALELPALFEKAVEYVERFHATGHRRGPADLRHLIRNRLRPAEHPGPLEGYFLCFEDEGEVVRQLMGVLTDGTWISSQTVLCDLNVVRTLRPDFDRSVPHLARHAAISIQRPDYRVIRAVTETLR